MLLRLLDEDCWIPDLFIVVEFHADADFGVRVVLKNLLPPLLILRFDDLEEFLRQDEPVVLLIEGDACRELELWS